MHASITPPKTFKGLRRWNPFMHVLDHLTVIVFAKFGKRIRTQPTEGIFFMVELTLTGFVSQKFVWYTIELLLGFFVWKVFLNVKQPSFQFSMTLVKDTCITCHLHTPLYGWGRLYERHAHNNDHPLPMYITWKVFLPIDNNCRYTDPVTTNRWKYSYVFVNPSTS